MAQRSQTLSDRGLIVTLAARFVRVKRIAVLHALAYGMDEVDIAHFTHIGRRLQVVVFRGAFREDSRGRLTQDVRWQLPTNAIEIDIQGRSLGPVKLGLEHLDQGFVRLHSLAINWQVARVQAQRPRRAMTVTLNPDITGTFCIANTRRGSPPSRPATAETITLTTRTLWLLPIALPVS
jgi:hypothetical protein